MKKTSNIWENTDRYDEQYICKTELYLLSMLSHSYNIVIYRGVGTPGHGKYVVDGLNATDKRFLKMLMKTVQLPGESTNDSYMAMYNKTSNADISLARAFQKHISDPTCSYGFIDHGKDRKEANKSIWTDLEHHVQDNKYVQQKPENMSWASTQYH